MVTATFPAPLYSESLIESIEVPEVMESVRVSIRAQERGVQGIAHLLETAGEHSGDFDTTTYGRVSFRRVDPLYESSIVADARLQERLEALCETLRAKY